MKKNIKKIVAATIVFLAVIFIGGNYTEEPKAPVYAPVEETVEEIVTEETVTEEVVEETTTVSTPSVDDDKMEKTVDSLRAKEEKIEGEVPSYEVPMTDEEELNYAKEQAASDNKDNVTELDCEEQIIAGTKTEVEQTEEIEIPEKEKVEVSADVELESAEANPETANQVVPEIVPIEEQLDSEIDFSEFGL